MFLIYLGLTIVGVVWAFLIEDGTKLRDSSALCLFWSWYNIDRADHRLHGVHRAAALPLRRTAGGGRRGDGACQAARLRPIACWTSRSAARGCWARPHADAGSTITMAFEGLWLPATVVRCGEHDFAVRFEDVGAARTDLIRLVYSGRYSAAIERIEPRRVAAAILGRVMR